MIELVVGPMFGGKSEYILSKASKHKAVGWDVLAFKPETDNRTMGIRSRIGQGMDAMSVKKWESIEEIVLAQNGKKTLVIIDECQFMPSVTESHPYNRVDGALKFPSAGRFLWNLRHKCRYDIHILVAGLLATTELTPFQTTQNIFAIADRITHLTAFCAECGDEAAFTICTVPKTEDVLIGDEIYSPRCARCLPIKNPNW